MYYKFITKNKGILIKIIALIALSFILKYISHRNFLPDSLLDTYQMYMGGPFLEESTSILQIISLLLISVLFIYFIPYEIVKEIKENEIYIKYRFEKNTKILFVFCYKECVLLIILPAYSNTHHCFYNIPISSYSNNWR